MTIQGSAIFGGGTSADGVTIAGLTAQIVGDRTNASYIVVRSSLGPFDLSSTTGDVVVTGNTGVETTLLNGFTYSLVTSLEPSSGQGGTLVTISGIALTGDDSSVASATIAGITSSVISQNSTVVVLQAGARSNGARETGTIRLSLADGAVVVSVGLADSSEVHEFTYEVAGAIDSVSPARGQVDTLVTIVGSQLFGYGSSLNSVTIDGVEVNSIVAQNTTYVVVRAGPNNASSASTVTLVSDTGAIVSRDSMFEYVGVGNITNVDPTLGQQNTVVTISGAHLLSGANSLSSVTLAGVEVKQIVSATSTSVVVVASLGLTEGAGDIVLSSLDGASVTPTNGFASVDVPTLTSVTPNS